MPKARLVITAVITEGRTQGEVARAYGVSQGWVSRLVARYREEGEAAFEPRSRRPRTSPRAIPDATVSLITKLRKDLAGQGLDAGPGTIAWHLEHHHRIRVSAATVSRYLARAGLVTPEPRKRPKSSYLRFEAELPNQCWQSDFTHYPLADGTGTEILTWLDDHSRYALSVTAWNRVTGPIVLATFRAAVAEHGVPASTLTDNGMVFTTRLSGGKGGRNGFEHELRRRGIVQKNGKPNHPQTQGKVERFQQTLKNWLAAQSPQPATLAQLQALLGAFTTTYNHHRPHRSLPHQATPPPPTRPGPKPPLVTVAATPTTGSALTGSTPTVRSPCATAASSTTSASAEPTPEPTSCSSSRTCTSASSTPPPANYCANSSSTPPATTSPPAAPQALRPGHHAHPANEQTPNPDCRFGVIPIS
jgi:transposase InsO family protein